MADKKGAPTGDAEIHRIRITLSSTNVKSLEKSAPQRVAGRARGASAARAAR